MALLQIKNLNVTYKAKGKEIKAVRNFELDIDLQDSIGIVGESGSGKSTLAMAILRMLPKKKSQITGEILFNNMDLLKMSEDEFRNISWKDISMVFQKSMNSLSPVHKIGTQISDIYKVHNPKAQYKEIRERMIEVFKLVNLSEKTLDCYPHELSGGMLQRVSIANSLIHYPQLLILDEATTALDVVTQGQILDEIMKLQEELKLTRIMITHDLSVVASSCKKVVVMYAGCLLEYGYVSEVLRNPKHPYTEELLNSYPSMNLKKDGLASISGSLPDLSITNKGCIFSDRCKKAKEICFNKVPELKDISCSCKVACHLVGGEKDKYTTEG